MNNERRKRLRKCNDLINQAYEGIEGVVSDENDAYDNLPDSLQDSERGQNMQNTIDALNDILSDLDSVTAALDEVVS